MVNFTYYDNGTVLEDDRKGLDPLSLSLVDMFDRHIDIHSDSQIEGKSIKSNFVLKELQNDLISLGFDVEMGRNHFLTIGDYFHPDAISKDKRKIVEIEAARGYLGNQFLKDYFEACYVPGIDYLCIAVRKVYRYNYHGKQKESFDYSIIKDNYFKFLNNKQVTTNLRQLLLIGY